jgi:hypothetical protein
MPIPSHAQDLADVTWQQRYQRKKQARWKKHISRVETGPDMIERCNKHCQTLQPISTPHKFHYLQSFLNGNPGNLKFQNHCFSTVQKTIKGRQTKLHTS